MSRPFACCWLSVIVLGSLLHAVQAATGQSTGEETPVAADAPQAKAESAEKQASSDNDAAKDAAAEDAAAAPEIETPVEKSALPPHLLALNPKQTVILDKKRNRVILQGTVCLVRGPLEVFACLKGTKEHESIVSIDTEAVTVHAALVAAGIDPGQPALWRPDYTPAEGPEIAVTVFWTDANGERQHAKAQDWIRDSRSGDVMKYQWVFGGSMFEKRMQYRINAKTRKREELGEKEVYLGEEGFLISVSNFTSAVLDVPVESSNSDAGLLYEAYAERIPPEGTKVQIVLSRIKKVDEKDGDAPNAKNPDAKGPDAKDGGGDSKNRPKDGDDVDDKSAER